MSDAACSNDGGASYAMAPVGSATSVDATTWTPKAGAVVAGNVAGAGTVYSCVCLKKCSCVYMTKTQSGQVQHLLCNLLLLLHLYEWERVAKGAVNATNIIVGQLKSCPFGFKKRKGRLLQKQSLGQSWYSHESESTVSTFKCLQLRLSCLASLVDCKETF